MPDGVIRRRNVTSRNRTGCVTCRARRLRCDETKPNCHNCTRLNIDCGGYVTAIKFKDQTEIWKRKQNKKKDQDDRPDAGHTPLPSSPLAARNGTATTPAQPTVPEISAHEDGFLSADNTDDFTPNLQEQSLYEAATSLTLISESVARERDGRGFNDTSARLQSTCNDTHVTFEVGTTNSCTPGSAVSSAAIEGAGASTFSPHQPETHSGWHIHADPCDRPLDTAPVIPGGLLESTKFPEDMIYYHHLLDPSPYGILSIISLNDIVGAEDLDSAFYHAALALSALDISLSNTNKNLASKAAIQALDHFIAALGTIRMAQLDDAGIATGCPTNQDKTISWLATVLLLANFELQRGQMKLWYIHSRAAVSVLSQHLPRIRDSPAGESLVRSFSRIAALLDIFDRAYSVKYSIASPEVSESLAASLLNSPQSSDRLLYILPRVIKLEEEWRSNPQHDLHWRQQAEDLIEELKMWRDTLDECDVPPLHEHTASPYAATQGPGIAIRPLCIPTAKEPVKAATTFMHYLISLLRLETRYLPGAGRELPAEAKKIILLVCRLAAGVPYASCGAVNAYGHGMLPAMMNAYYMSEDIDVKNWVKSWIAGFPRDREGIWHVRHAHRMLDYVDQEYNRRGSRHNWEIIKVRMVDLEDDATPLEGEDDGDPDRFFVEIYSRCKRG
ncbi:Transcriptional regulatory protein moc3 [Colletotrichum sidae]|uniref:Transcriptional regulatory protein moc3 n=1 Tax=Colletotrichum sidae TaxID=1347389 RepID=A0A4R8TSJ1_9PEZI|nr:Transcriptional regulatory protein moc3 [Colletotrichum sidae]